MIKMPRKRYIPGITDNKKILIILIALGLFAGFSSTAQAGYSISIGYNTGKAHGFRNDSDHRGYRSYPRGHYYQPHYQYYQYYPYYYPVQVSNAQERVGISDVIVLSKAGIDDNIIIDKIRRTGSVFDLSVEEVEALRREGVSARVVNYMLST